jgi:hypothetical protein
VSPRTSNAPSKRYDADLQETVGSLGYFGIAQQSGAVGEGFDRLEVPRYPMATNYEDMQRFAVSVDSRPLPVSKVSAGPRIQTAGESSRHSFAFDLAPGDFRLAQLACYNSSSGARLALNKQTAAGATRISMQLPDWGAGRRKINCTAPAAHDAGVFYWYSYLWLVKQADGSWYRE